MDDSIRHAVRRRHPRRSRRHGERIDEGEMGRADRSDTLEMSTVNGGITLALPPTLNTDV